MRRLLILVAMLSLVAPMLRAQDVHVSGTSRGPAYAIGGGTAQAQTVTLNPVRPLVAGLEINFLPNAANTSAGPTLAVNGGSAITITKLGTAALIAGDITTTAIASVIYDGTRFQLRNPQTASATAAYNTVASGGTTVAQRSTLNFNATGSAGINCADNGGATRTDCTVTGILGPPAPTIKTISSSSYTVLDSDNTWRDVFTNAGAVAVTLPQASTISASPFIATRYTATTPGNATSYATTTFSQSAGNILLYSFQGTSLSGSTPAVVSLTDTAGDTFTPLFSLSTGSSSTLYVYQATGISANGSNAVTINFGGNTNTSQARITVTEWTGIGLDHLASNTSSSSATAGVSNAAALGVGWANFSGGVNQPPSGWTLITNTAFTDTDYRLLDNMSSITYQQSSVGNGVIAVASFSTTAQATFVAGWQVTFVNNTSRIVTITPTVSTINGAAALKMAPNEQCLVMSDGTNYQALCGFYPSASGGSINSPIGIAGINTSNTAADVGTTTLITTGAADALYEVKAAAVCRSSINGSETVTITYTDTNSIAQTFTASTGTCNGGSPTAALISSPFRAKAGTALQYATTHTTATPNYDISVQFFQLSTQ